MAALLSLLIAVVVVAMCYLTFYGTARQENIHTALLASAVTMTLLYALQRLLARRQRRIALLRRVKQLQAARKANFRAFQQLMTIDDDETLHIGSGAFDTFERLRRGDLKAVDALRYYARKCWRVQEMANPVTEFLLDSAEKVSAFGSD